MSRKESEYQPIALLIHQDPENNTLCWPTTRHAKIFMAKKMHNVVLRDLNKLRKQTDGGKRYREVMDDEEQFDDFLMSDSTKHSVAMTCAHIRNHLDCLEEIVDLFGVQNQPETISLSNESLFVDVKFPNNFHVPDFMVSRLQSYIGYHLNEIENICKHGLKKGNTVKNQITNSKKKIKETEPYSLGSFFMSCIWYAEGEIQKFNRTLTRPDTKPSAGNHPISSVSTNQGNQLRIEQMGYLNYIMTRKLDEVPELKISQDMLTKQLQRYPQVRKLIDLDRRIVVASSCEQCP